jgi:hypothetical protein
LARKRRTSGEELEVSAFCCVLQTFRKRWFILSGNTLAYYTAKSNKIKGSISLDTCIIRVAKNRSGSEHTNCLELINTAVSELVTPSNDDDESESVRTLFFDAQDDKERQEWFIAITNKIALLKYQRQMKLLKKKDDIRVINLFDASTLKDLDLSQESESNEPEAVPLASPTTVVSSPRGVIKRPTLHYEVCVALKEPIRLSIYLQTINFQNAGVGNNGAKELSDALRDNKSVQKLNLSGNLITEIGIGSIASMLAINSTLTNLDLSNNALSDESMRILSEQALKTNTSLNLKRLTLNQNTIGDKGIEFLVDAFIANLRLRLIEALELAHNQLGDGGCEFIARLIDNQTQIGSVIMSVLDIGYNNIGNDGAKAIAKVMSSNKNIKEINLEFNQIGYQGTKDLAFCCVKNTKIEKLVLGGNRLGEQALYLLANTSMAFPRFILTSK